MATVFSIIIISSQILEILSSELPVTCPSLALRGDSLRLPQVSALAGAASGLRQISPHLRSSPFVNNIPVGCLDSGNGNVLASPL